MLWPKSAKCSKRPRRQRKSSGKNLSWLFELLGGRLMRVNGGSMVPELQPGEMIFVNQRAYRRRMPLRGELVVARPLALGGTPVVKRVAGLPNERISIDGRHWRLGASEFFLLSEQLACGADSRRFGAVTRDELLGAVRCRLWPWRVFVPAAVPSKPYPVVPQSSHQGPSEVF